MVCVWEPNLHKEGPDPRRVHFPGVRPELRMLLSQSIADDDIAHFNCFNIVRRKV